MSDKYYYINGQWVTWQTAHNQGYTTTEPTLCTFYTSSLTTVSLFKSNDPNEDNGYFYDSTNHQWVSDITTLGYYNPIGSINLYSGSNATSYQGYSNSVLNNTPVAVVVNNTLVSLSSLYSEGKTTYPCQDYIVQDGELISWYDSSKLLYWDNRAGQTGWKTSAPQIESNDENNWTPPSQLALDFTVDYTDWTEEEPLKLNATGYVPYSYPSPAFTSELIMIDSVIDTYDLFVSGDERNSDLNLYLTEDTVFNQVAYETGQAFVCTMSLYYEDVEGYEIFYKSNSGTIEAFTFYYRTDFENHSGERIYFNEDYIPETYNNFRKLGFSKTLHLSDYSSINGIQLDPIYMDDSNLIYDSESGNWVSISSYITDHVVYTYKDYVCLKIATSSENWYLDYPITTNSTSFRTSDSNYTKKLYYSDGSEFLADDDAIYIWDVPYNSSVVSSVSNMVAYTGSNDVQFCFLILREDTTPLEPFSGTSNNLYAYVCQSQNAHQYFSTKPLIKVKRYYKYNTTVTPTELPTYKVTSYYLPSPKIITTETGVNLTIQNYPSHTHLPYIYSQAQAVRLYSSTNVDVTSLYRVLFFNYDYSTMRCTINKMYGTTPTINLARIDVSWDGNFDIIGAISNNFNGGFRTGRLYKKSASNPVKIILSNTYNNANSTLLYKTLSYTNTLSCTGYTSSYSDSTINSNTNNFIKIETDNDGDACAYLDESYSNTSINVGYLTINL